MADLGSGDLSGGDGSSSTDEDDDSRTSSRRRRRRPPDPGRSEDQPDEDDNGTNETGGSQSNLSGSTDESTGGHIQDPDLEPDDGTGNGSSSGGGAGGSSGDDQTNTEEINAAFQSEGVGVGQQGVETSEGRVSEQAQDLEGRVIRRSAALDDPSQVAVRREGDTLQVELTDAGRQQYRDVQTRQVDPGQRGPGGRQQTEQFLQESAEGAVEAAIAEESAEFDAGDIEAERTDDGFEARVTEEAVREQVAEQNEGVSAEDVVVKEGENGGYNVSLTEERRRAQIRQDVAAQDDRLDSDEVTVSEGPEQYVSGGDARLANEAGSDGSDLQRETYTVEFDEDAFDATEGNGEDGDGGIQETLRTGEVSVLGRDIPVGTESIREEVSDRYEVGGFAEQYSDGELDQSQLSDDDLFRVDLDPNRGGFASQYTDEDVGEEGSEITISEGDVRAVAGEGSQQLVTLPTTAVQEVTSLGIGAGEATNYIIRGEDDQLSTGDFTEATGYQEGAFAEQFTSEDEIGEGEDRTGRAEEVTDAVGQDIRSSAQYLQNNPEVLGGSLIAGGVLGIPAGVATGAAVGRTARFVGNSRSRLSVRGSGLTQGVSRRLQTQIRSDRNLGSDNRAQGDLSKTIRRQESDANGETTAKTITRDDPEADSSDLTSEEWAEELFEQGNSRDVGSARNVERETTPIPEQRDIDIQERQTGARSRSQSPEEQLPPKEEFPSEEAYQRELERLRERQREQATETVTEQDIQGETTVEAATVQEVKTATETAGANAPGSRTVAVTAAASARGESDEVALDSQTVEEKETVTRTKFDQEIGVTAAAATQVEEDASVGAAEDVRTVEVTDIRTDPVTTTKEVTQQSEGLYEPTTTQTVTDTVTTTEATTSELVDITAEPSGRRVRPAIDFPSIEGDASGSRDGADVFANRFDNPVADPDEAIDSFVGGGDVNLEDLDL